jgi:hypothetical protein
LYAFILHLGDGALNQNIALDPSHIGIITESRGQWLAVLLRTYEAQGSDVDRETGFQIFVCFFSLSDTLRKKYCL